MNLAEKLLVEFGQLTEEKQKEVINFIEFIKINEQKEIENLMDAVITENKEALEELRVNRTGSQNSRRFYEGKGYIDLDQGTY